MNGFNVEFELGKLQRKRKKSLLPVSLIHPLKTKAAGLFPEKNSPFLVVYCHSGFCQSCPCTWNLNSVILLENK